MGVVNFLKLTFSVFAVLASSIAVAHAGNTNLTIRSIAGGDQFCMDASQDRKAEGTKVFIYRCHGHENQRWTMTQDADGTSVIIGTGGLCLDVKGSHSRSDGTPIELWNCHFGTNQRFMRSSDGTIREVESHKCLLALAQKDGAPIVLDDCKGAPQEYWQITQ